MKNRTSGWWLDTAVWKVARRFLTTVSITFGIKEDTYGVVPAWLRVDHVNRVSFWYYDPGMLDLTAKLSCESKRDAEWALRARCACNFHDYVRRLNEGPVKLVDDNKLATVLDWLMKTTVPQFDDGFADATRCDACSKIVVEF